MTELYIKPKKEMMQYLGANYTPRNQRPQEYHCGLQELIEKDLVTTKSIEQAKSKVTTARRVKKKGLLARIFGF